MSRRNKVNPDHYTIAGRLAPDDLARERRKQSEQLTGGIRERQQKPMPPWMANDADTGSGGGEQTAAADTAQAEAVEAEDAPAVTTGVSETAAQPPETPRATGRRKPRPATKPAAGKKKAKAKAKTAKASAGRGTPKGRKAAKGRGSAARKASPQRTGRKLAAARKTKRVSPPKKAKKTTKAARKAKKR